VTRDLAEEFEANRDHLRAMAYHMLGSHADTDDALQEAWLRASRADTSTIENWRSWLVTIVAHVCLNMLRARRSRLEKPLETYVPDPIVSRGGGNPEQEAIESDSVGLALMVALETLSPPERLAVVLHDVFAVSFDEIAIIVDRTPAAVRQIASRARHRVQGAKVPAIDLHRQEQVVSAFLAASRGGNFDALLAVLDPDAVLRTDGGASLATASGIVRGSRQIAGQAIAAGRLELIVRPVLVNGAPGLASWNSFGEPFSVMGINVAGEKIVEINVLLDPERLRQLDLAALRN
jgi:RNA polymerase sigma-70 factor (ECF subfamily)